MNITFMYICHTIANIHKMKVRILYLAILLLIIFVGCKKEAEIKPLPEAGYPTTYKVLTQSEWDVVNSNFQKINIYEGLTLNEHGFAEGNIALNESDSITKDFIISIVDSLVVNYEKYLGIPENTEIIYEEKLRIDASYMIPFGSDDIKSFFEILEEYGNESGMDELHEIKYDFFLNQRFIKNKRFLGTDIHFYFNRNENILKLSGNWYPKVFIPSEEIYTLNDVIPIACRELLKQTGKDFWESKHEFGTIKIFTRLKTERGVEIRECWRINDLINDFTYGDMFIDTQTGELIKYGERGIYI